MNYAELVTAVENTCENTFETADMNRFIALAEQTIYNAVQLPALRKNVTGTLTASNKYLGVPADYLATFSLAVVDALGAYTYLLDKDVNFIREAYPTPTSTGTPKYYANFDDTSFIVGPTPDTGYTAELHYFYYPESIVTAGTTWLGDNFDSALFNAALVEAIRFMKGEPDMVKLYQDQYVQALSLLKNLGDGKLRQDTYRSGQTRMKPN